MRTKWGVVWRVVKLVLALLIIGGVGWQFAKILQRPELWQRALRLDPAWLVLAALLYAAGFACWGGYWLRLLHLMGQRIPLPLAARAYFVSQLGKYVPGKGLAVVMRVGYARAAGVRTSVAAITAVYETMTEMAAGAIVAAVLFPLLEMRHQGMAWIAVGLLALAGIPILPGVFNRLAFRIAKPFVKNDAPPLPKLTTAALLAGLLQSAVGWLCLGTSLLALLHGIRYGGDSTAEVPWLACVAYVALSYVVGFLMVFAPGGLGVREAGLQQLLAAHLTAALGSEGTETYAVVIVLLLRLIWTITELSLAGLASLLPRLVARKSPA